MSHPLDGFRLKLNRANSHFETLDAEIESWFKQKPYGVVGHYEAGPPEKYVFSFRVFDPPPAHWSLLIGEFAHQARSALDHLVWQLVMLNGRTPTLRNQFPIVYSEKSWKGRHGASRLIGVAEKHIDWIHAVQPYRRLGPGDPPIVRLIAREALGILASMNNEDKHRVLVPAFGTLTSIGFTILSTQDVEPLSESVGEAIFDVEMKDRAPLLEIPVVANGPNPYVEMEINERIEVSVDHRIDVDDSVYISEVAVREGMQDILNRLQFIFELFIPEFG